MMLKKSDYIIISIAFFFLGIFSVSQYYAGKEYRKVVQPENNEVIALEVSKLTKGNANLRQEVTNLTADLDIYRNSSEERKGAYEKYQDDSGRLAVIDGMAATSGQGILLKITGKLSVPQVVDLINAIKNMGSEVISINGTRLTLGMDFNRFASNDTLEIGILGNSKLLKSAMERRGGIVEQIASKDVKVEIFESEMLTIPAGVPLELKYAKIVKDE